jgi:hypothetical protein
MEDGINACGSYLFQMLCILAWCLKCNAHGVYSDSRDGSGGDAKGTRGEILAPGMALGESRLCPILRF